MTGSIDDEPGFRIPSHGECRNREIADRGQVLNAHKYLGVAEPQHHSATFPPSTLSARRAREFVAAALEGAHYPDPTISERLVLATSELVTNSIVHAGTECVLHLTIAGEWVYLDVLDGNPERPTRTPPALSETSGRGMVLVDALVDAWGVEDVEGASAKLVWVRVDTAGDL